MTWRAILMMGLVTAGLGGLAAREMIQWAKAPVLSETDHPPSKIVVIPSGSSFQQVATLLEQERLIRSRFAFEWLGRLQEADRKIHPGEYEFNAAMPPDSILSKLLAGRVVLHSVTIPEGYTLVQIGNVLAEQRITDQAEFMRLTHDKTFIHHLNIQADSLEGYLYPDTYFFARSTPAKDVIKAMVDQLDRVLSDEWRERAKELHMTIHEVLTLASVIEKETSAASERPHISSVFHNRLKRKIPLQSDPTVIYGLPNFDGNLRKQDLRHSSPYNTYRWVGLPPGPISNPGADSIRAALYPASTSDLYFVSKNDGTHHFSPTLIQHNKAVEQYQKRPFRRRGRSERPVMSAAGGRAADASRSRLDRASMELVDPRRSSAGLRPDAT